MILADVGTLLGRRLCEMKQPAMDVAGCALDIYYLKVQNAAIFSLAYSPALSFTFAFLKASMV